MKIKCDQILSHRKNTYSTKSEINWETKVCTVFDCDAQKKSYHGTIVLSQTKWRGSKWYDTKHKILNSLVHFADLLWIYYLISIFKDPHGSFVKVQIELQKSRHSVVTNKRNQTFCKEPRETNWVWPSLSMIDAPGLKKRTLRLIKLWPFFELFPMKNILQNYLFGFILLNIISPKAFIAWLYIMKLQF